MGLLFKRKDTVKLSIKFRQDLKRTLTKLPIRQKQNLPIKGQQVTIKDTREWFKWLGVEW